MNSSTVMLAVVILLMLTKIQINILFALEVLKFEHLDYKVF